MSTFTKSIGGINCEVEITETETGAITLVMSVAGTRVDSATLTPVMAQALQSHYLATAVAGEDA